MKHVDLHSKLPKGQMWEMLWLVLMPMLSTFVFSVHAAEVHQTRSRSEFEFLLQKPSSLQEFEVKFKKMDEIRSAAEGALKDLLKQRSNDLELQLRLAELNLQKARDVEHYSLELEFANQHEKSKQLKAEFKALCQKGLALHEQLLKKHASHPLAAEILLGMARTRLSLGEKAKAFNDAIAGIKAHKGNPNKVLLNLWIVKGDAAFAQSRPVDALQAYEEARGLAEKSKEDPSYIVYKLAWAHFNLKDSERAVSHLDELLSRNDDNLSLKKEAVQDFSLFVVDLNDAELEKRGGVEGIFNYLLKKSGRDAGLRAFDGLGKNYFKNGHRQKALKAYEILLKQDANDPKNLDRAMLVVEWSQSLANKWELTEKYQWLLGSFGPQSDWYKAQAQRPDVQKKAYDLIEASMRNFALNLHAEAVKESLADIRNKKEDTVAKLYDDYLKSFSEEPRIHYYRAEIHRRKEALAEAGTHYDRYLLLFSSIPTDKLSALDKKQRDEAAWSSIQMWSKAIDKDPKYVPQMLKSSDYFVENFPKHAEAPEVALDAARVEMKQKNSAVALKRIEALFAKYPRTKQASLGVHAALDILNQEKDYVNLALKARVFLDNIAAWAMPGEKDKLSKELNDILSKTEAKACESLSQTNGKEIEAAVCFESFARSFKDNPLAPKALMVASEMNSKLGRTDASLQNLENLVKNYPDSEPAPVAFSKIALAYEKNFEFTKAVDVFDILLRRNEKLVDKSKIALRLLVLLEGLGDEKRLEKLLDEKFIAADVKKDFFERRALRFLASLEKAEHEGALEKGKFKAAKNQQELADLEKIEKLLPLEATLRLARLKGVLHRSVNKLDLADQVWMAALKIYWKSSAKKDPRVLEAAARLRLEQASVWEIAFRNTDFSKNGAKKTELYGKLENWYSEVVGFKSPSVALEALLQSAKLAKQFYEELEAYMPKAPESDRPTLTQVVGELKAKSELLIGQVSERAKAWKVLSPAVVEAMSLKSSLAVTAAGSTPWGRITLWTDLDADQTQWTEWKDTDAALKSQIKDKRARSSSKRAAFVLMTRQASLKDNEVGSWSQLLNDKAGVQIRIQALINDRELRLSQIYIDQYRDIFGDDAFVPYASGLQAWAEGNAEEAFRGWLNPVKKDDFRLAFLRLSWVQGLEQKTLDKKEFKVLADLAKGASQKHMLAKVCLEKKLDCGADTFEEALAQNAEPPFERDFAWSTFDYRRQAYTLSLEQGIQSAKSIAELESHFARMQGFYGMRFIAATDSKEKIVQDFGSLKKLVEGKSFELRHGQERVVAGTLTEGNKQ